MSFDISIIKVMGCEAHFFQIYFSPERTCCWLSETSSIDSRVSVVESWDSRVPGEFLGRSEMYCFEYKPLSDWLVWKIENASTKQQVRNISFIAGFTLSVK